MLVNPHDHELPWLTRLGDPGRSHHEAVNLWRKDGVAYDLKHSWRFLLPRRTPAQNAIVNAPMAATIEGLRY
jgi:hypothetical protein